jgi:hypothetical protein
MIVFVWILRSDERVWKKTSKDKNQAKKFVPHSEFVCCTFVPQIYLLKHKLKHIITRGKSEPGSPGSKPGKRNSAGF